MLQTAIFVYLKLTVLPNIHEDTACACRKTRMLGTCCNTWWKGG